MTAEADAAGASAVQPSARLQTTPEGKRYGSLLLDAFQLAAIEAIEAARDVIVAAPTGAGKTVIAEYAIDKALADGYRAIYTSPIKALSNQKYRDFCERYPGRIGLVTGDVTLDPDAPVLIMTTEIFRNAVVDAPERYADVRYAIFDEVHYINDAERGTVWEESLILAPPSIRFVCLSATIPNVDEIADWIGEVREAEVQVVVEQTRPVPLEYRFYSEKHGHFGYKQLKNNFGRRRFSVQRARRGARAIIDRCANDGTLPALYFAFNRRECEAKAWHNRHRKLLDETERRQIEALLDELIERYGVAQYVDGSRLWTLWRRGIAYHHAGMLPTLKEIVERLFTAGLIKLLFATETFAVGINMPACAVIFDAVEKFDGVDYRPLRTLEFQQMAGRAGRRGMDRKGYVFCNLDALEHVNYNQLRRTVSGRIEPIRSQLNLGYSTILNLRARLGAEMVHTVAERSFGRYQDFLRGKNDPKAQKTAERRDRRRQEQLTRKLDLLAELGYVDAEPAEGQEGALTARGRFAASVQGYEMQATELFFGGELEGLDAHQLAAVFAALVYEGKKRTWFDQRHDGMLRPVARKVIRRIRRLRQQEQRFGIDELSKAPEFDIAGVVYAWSRGASLNDVAGLTNLPPGDVVRTLRLTVMLLRNVRHAAKGHEALSEALTEAVDGLKRDEADAEAQLRVH